MKLSINLSFEFQDIHVQDYKLTTYLGKHSILAEPSYVLWSFIEHHHILMHFILNELFLKILASSAGEYTFWY